MASYKNHVKTLKWTERIASIDHFWVPKNLTFKGWPAHSLIWPKNKVDSAVIFYSCVHRLQIVCIYIFIFIIIIILTLDFYYNCSFNARAYFERALVLLGVYVGKYILDWLFSFLETGSWVLSLFHKWKGSWQKWRLIKITWKPWNEQKELLQ